MFNGIEDDDMVPQKVEFFNRRPRLDRFQPLEQ